MANGFGSLYVGASGLQSAQNSLNTTSNNNDKRYEHQTIRQSIVSGIKIEECLLFEPHTLEAIL